MPQDRTEEFVRLLTKHDRALYRYIRTLLPDPVSAEEVQQDTATSLWRRFEEYDAEKPFFPWACRFAYFEVLRYRKSKSREKLIFNDEILEGIAQTRAEEDETLELRREALTQCLEQLDEEDRRLIQRRYGSKQTVAALADELGITAKKLYHALERIRSDLMDCVNATVPKLEKYR